MGWASPPSPDMAGSCWLGAPLGLLTGAPACGLSSVVAQGSQTSWMVIGFLSAALPRETDEAHASSHTALEDI